MYSLLIVYLMTPFFFIILFFGERSQKSYSLVIFISCVLNLLTDPSIDKNLSSVELEKLFIFYTNLSILWDSACALLLITSKIFSQESGKQAILLCFAVLCHIMVAYGLVSLFRIWYVELIILIGILQMMAASDGFITAFRSLRKFIHWIFNYNSCSDPSLLEPEEAESRL